MVGTGCGTRSKLGMDVVRQIGAETSSHKVSPGPYFSARILLLFEQSLSLVPAILSPGHDHRWTFENDVLVLPAQVHVAAGCHDFHGTLDIA